MKKILLLFLLVFLILSCSDKKPERKFKKNLSKSELEEILNKPIRYRIDLISLKYGITDESFKKDLFDHIEKHRFDFFPESINENELLMISKKNKVPLKIIASILYDYEILSKKDSP